MNTQKRFGRFFIASLRKTASIVYGLEAKKDKLEQSKKDIDAQIDFIQQQIDSFNSSIVKETGFTSLDLIERNVNDKGLVKWDLKYPETIIPDNQTAQNVGTPSYNLANSPTI
jgi:polygalacturonase